MAWTELTRTQHMRKINRYPSDLTDAEWSIVRPLLPGRNRLARPPGLRIQVTLGTGRGLRRGRLYPILRVFVWT